MKRCGAAVDLGGDYKSPTPLVRSIEWGEGEGEGEGGFIAHEGIEYSQNRQPQPLHPMPRRLGRGRGSSRARRGTCY